MKARQRIRTSKKTGLPPGTLVHVGEKRADQVEISVFDFDQAEYAEVQSATPQGCAGYVDRKTVSWINVTGLHDVELLRAVGESLDIHPLIMEDVLNTEQRPKLQDLGDSIFIIIKMARPGDTGFSIEQISLIIKDRCVITFQERKGDVFEPVRERIRKNRGRIRKAGADYLAYALIDSIVDGYFPYLELISGSLEETDTRILETSDIDSLHELHSRKRELILIRKNTWPMREIMNSLIHSESALIKKSTYIYLGDVYDHTLQIIDTTESLRDVVSGLLELYLSTSSSKANEVMKVLTIIATIFIPLTFVAGIYGMNFVHMPELGAKAGYPIVLGVMAAIAGGMLLFFKRKKWL
jgi:magnesium transporter